MQSYISSYLNFEKIYTYITYTLQNKKKIIMNIYGCGCLIQNQLILKSTINLSTE